MGKSKEIEEPEMDLLSEIINKINDVYGSQISVQDKLDLESMQIKLKSDEGLLKVIHGDNSETNKRQKFDAVLEKTIMSFFNERFDFFKKIDDPKIKSFIGQLFFEQIKSEEIGKLL